MDLKPLELTLEFTRSSREPFRLGEQEYLHRKEAGRFLGASLRWEEALLKDLAELGHPEPSPATVHRLGELLRGFLDQVGWESYEARIQEALRAKQPVLLSFQFDADELYALPWELLTLRGSGQRLAELPGLLLRYEWPETRTVPLDPDPPKGGRILYAWSSAGGLIPSERQGQALRQACARGGIAFDPRRDVLERASARELAAALSSPEPVAILHLLCHGAQREPHRLGLLLDASRPGGEPEFIDGQALTGILAPHARTLRLVVLSACQSGATGAPGSALPGVARALHQAGIQCVVASRLPLSVEGAVEMTETLYDELLGTPCSLEQALGLARDRLRRTPTRLDWASLQLYARAMDGTDTRPLALRPYRGLMAFQPEHSRFFFGREPLQEELLNRVDESHLRRRLHEASTQRRHRFQVVAGASGSGKSSLVLAGVVPHVDKRTWDVVVTRPGEGGGFAVAKPGARAPRHEPRSGSETSPAPGGALRSLWTVLHHQWAPPEAEGPVTDTDPAELLEEAARMRQARPERRLLLVVDQFEEVFTQVPSLTERQAYVGVLWALAEKQELGVIVLSTLRVDYFGHCGELAVNETGKRLDAVVYSDEHRMFVTQLQGEQLQAIIEGPARKVGLRLDEGLMEVLQRDVGAEPGALPLLEYALDQLWERRVGNRLTHQAYTEIGGVGGALTSAANRLLATFSQAESRVARQLLVELVDFSDDVSPHTRRRGWLAQLRPSNGEEQALFDRVLNRLVGSRLLVKGGDGSSPSEAGIWVEVAHESLIRRWEMLTEWVRADRKAAQERRELRALTEKWKAHLGAPDKGESYLLTGYRLEAARHLQREYGGQLAQDIHQFIDDSWRRAEARRRATRLRIASLLTASVVIALVMAVLATQARKSAEAAHRANAEARRQAQVARDLSRVMLARGQFRSDPTTSLLFLRDVERPELAPAWHSEVHTVLDEPLTEALLKGHSQDVLWVDYSPDGKHVATGSRDGTARVWDSHGREVLKLPRGAAHGKPVIQVTFSRDGRWLVASTQDGQAHVYPLEGEEQARPTPFQEDLRAVAFSPAGAWVITATANHSVKLWQGLEGSAPLHVLQKPGPGAVSQVAFNTTGTHALAVFEGYAQVWRAGEWATPVRIPRAGIISAALSPDGTHIAVTVPTASGNRAEVWRVSDQKRLWERCGGEVTHAEFSPKNEQVLIAFVDFTVRIRRLSHDSCDGPTLSGHASSINWATFSPDGNWVLTASNDTTSRLWPVTDDAVSEPLVLKGHGSAVLCAAFSPDGGHVLTGSKDETARLWALKKKVRFSSRLPHPDAVWAAAVSADGQSIASASGDGLARLWSSSGQLLAEMKGHEGVLRAVALSPDGQWLVTAGVDDKLLLWSISNLSASGAKTSIKLMDESRQRNLTHLSAAFSPGNGALRLATGGSDGQLYLWKLEVSNGQARLQPEDLRAPPRHGGPILSVAFDAQGERLITSSEEKVAKVWDAATGEPRQTLEGHEDWIRSATFSPDGQYALTSSLDGTARVWDLRPQKPQAILIARHGDALRGAAFSPDQKHFATAAVDGLVHVWSLENKEQPKPILVLRGHMDRVTSIAYVGEQRLVTSSIDRTIRLWNKLEPESTPRLLEELTTATSLCLEPEQWERHMGSELPESSRQHYEACRKRLTPELEPGAVSSTQGDE
jgi:WD40 repeat protein